MQIGEARMSALIVAGLTGVALTVVLAQGVGLATALSISVPAAGVMAVVLVVLAGGGFKRHGDKSPKEKTTEGK